MFIVVEDTTHEFHEIPRLLLLKYPCKLFENLEDGEIISVGLTNESVLVFIEFLKSCNFENTNVLLSCGKYFGCPKLIQEIEMEKDLNSSFKNKLRIRLKQN